MKSRSQQTGNKMIIEEINEIVKKKKKKISMKIRTGSLNR